MSVLGGVVLVSGVALAQPTPPAGSPPAPGAGAGAGSAVQPIEDAPPSDIEGRDENPDAPQGTLDEVKATTVAPAPVKKAGYPIEESQRPITLPQNMGEVSIAPHLQVKPYIASDALRFRYGITRQIQLGLTYVYFGAYDDPATVADKVTFQAGKAGGIDVTVLITNWLGVKAGIPMYLDPFAMSFAAGAPMKFIFEKFALGGLDDVLNITLPVGAEFPPSFYQEGANAVAAENDETGSQQSRGTLRFAGYGVYQHKPNLALIGRLGIENDLGGGGGAGPGTGSGGGTTTFIRAGVQLTPKKFVDVGGSLGFDDLSAAGSFGLAGFLALRI